ncbi:MAG TPA: hypothetical protein VF819_07925, partial [Nitrospira sp.]
LIRRKPKMLTDFLDRQGFIRSSNLEIGHGFRAQRWDYKSGTDYTMVIKGGLTASIKKNRAANRIHSIRSASSRL